MRVFGRILYALAAVGFFLLAFTYSKDLIQNKYLEDTFGASLTDESGEYPRFYYFYTSIPNYHNNDPILDIDSNGYEIVGYEVLQSNINYNNELETKESMYLIVYSDYQALSKVKYVHLENDINDEVLDINLQRFKFLNILNGVNDEGTIYIPKDWLIDGYTRIKLIDSEENILVETTFNMTENDFIIKDFIETYFLNNNRLPNIDDFSTIQNNNIFPNKPHIASGYEHIFYTAMGIYFSGLFISTYFIFFKKKKRNY